MEGIEGLETAQPEPVSNNTPDESKASDKVDNDVPADPDVTTFPEDDDPESNVGDVAE